MIKNGLIRKLGLGLTGVGILANMYGCATNAELLAAGGTGLAVIGKTNEQVGAGLIAKSIGDNQAQKEAAREGRMQINIGGGNNLNIEELKRIWNSGQRNMFIPCKGWTDYDKDNEVNVDELIDIRNEFSFNDEKMIAYKIIGQKGKKISVGLFYKANNIGLGLLAGLLGDNQRSMVITENNPYDPLTYTFKLDYPPGSLLVKFYAENEFLGSQEITIK